MSSKTDRVKLKYLYPYHTKYSDEDENDDKKKGKNGSYFSFIIKMLENPNYNNSKKRPINKKLINKLQNNPFKKSKNNSLDKNNTERIRLNLNNTKTKIINNKHPLKNNISYSFKKNKKINDSYRNNKILNQYNGSKFRTFTINSYKYKDNNYNNIEDSKPIKNKNNKEKDNRSTRNRNILNKLYGYNKKYIFSKSNILKKKNLIELDNYQNNILKISQRKLSRDNLIRLYTELQTIKTDAEMIKPLPPINYPALVVHSFKEVDDREKHKPIISYENKKLKDMDEYEKELFIIKKSNKFKKAKNVRNKRLYKIFEILPEHVVDVVFKNKNKII